MVKSNCLSTKSCPLSLISRLVLGHLPEPWFSHGLFWGLTRMIHGKLLNMIWGNHSLVRARDRLSWMTCAAQEMNPTYGHGEDTSVICCGGWGGLAPGDNAYYMAQGRVIIAMSPVLHTDFSIRKMEMIVVPWPTYFTSKCFSLLLCKRREPYRYGLPWGPKGTMWVKHLRQWVLEIVWSWSSPWFLLLR